MSLIFVLLLAGVAQQQEPPAAAQAPLKPPSDDIVVTGVRDIGELTDLDDPTSPVRPKTLSSGRTGAGATASRTVFAQAQFYARCTIRRSSGDAGLLRATLDGRINGALQAFSQQRLGQINRTCLLGDTQGTSTRAAKFDGTYYDRGALFIEALKTFAPDLQLTAAQTGDPVVQRRFDAREISLAKFRLPVDRQYFEIAVCLVRLQPGLSVRLVMTDTPVATINRLEAAIVNRGRVCVGNARNVYFDATQFRFYIADAVYRWAVAARGVDTLIPDG